MSVETAGAVRMNRVIRADRQRVWDAWTRPEEQMKWSCPVPGGLKEVVSDLRVGGAFELRMEIDGKPHTAFGVYREVIEPSRLVYSWDWREEDNAMGETLVTVQFRDVQGGTEVMILHEGFPAVEAREGHEEGWTACIANLEAVFETG